MMRRELINAVRDLVLVRDRDSASMRAAGLECGEPGHGLGHSCLAVPAETDASELIMELTRWYDLPQRLVVDGRVTPLPAWHSGRSLIERFGGDLVQLSAWPYFSWWIGCGVAESGVVLFVAQRAGVATGELSDQMSPVDRLVALTDWHTDSPYEVDWTVVEDRLGTALPADYRALVEAFGSGEFVAWLRLHVAEDLEAAPLPHDPDTTLREPYGLFPTPGGLLQWADSVQGDSVFWLTEGQDPDQWPIMVQPDTDDGWYRFEGSTTEFVYGLFTDPEHDFSKAAYVDRPWFVASAALPW